jgi:hypothetical protein
MRALPKAPQGGEFMTPRVLGLDLSLTAAAAVYIPWNWEDEGFAWKYVPTAHAGFSLKQDASEDLKLARLQAICEEILAFAEKWEITHAFIEQYAFSMMQSRAHALGEVGGTVKLDLYRKLGVVTVPVVASSARKLLFGKLPAKDAKKHAQARLKLIYPDHSWSEDEGDAFIVANFGRAEVGLPMLTCAET